MTTTPRLPDGLTPLQQGQVRADFEGLQAMLDDNGWAVVTARFPLPPGASEDQRVYLNYTVGMTPLGLHELCLQSRSPDAGHDLLALVAKMMQDQDHSVPLDEGDTLHVEGVGAFTARYHRNLTPFTQVTMRYTFPRMVELTVPRDQALTSVRVPQKTLR